MRERRLEKRAIGPLRPKPEQPHRSARNRLAARIDDPAPNRVGPGKGQVDAASSGPYLHRLKSGCETWGLRDEICHRPRFDPECEATMVVRLDGRDGIAVSPPLAVEDLCAGHGLAVGRQDRPIDARSAPEPEGRRTIAQGGQWLEGLLHVRGMLVEAEIMVGRDLDRIRLRRGVIERPAAIRAGPDGLGVDIDPLVGSGIALLDADDNHGVGQRLTILVENASADRCRFLRQEEEMVWRCGRSRRVDPASGKRDKAFAVGRQIEITAGDRVGERVLETGHTFSARCRGQLHVVRQFQCKGDVRDGRVGDQIASFDGERVLLVA